MSFISSNIFKSSSNMFLVFQAEPKAGGSITDIALSDEDDDDDMEEIFPAVGPYQVSHPNS